MPCTTTTSFSKSAAADTTSRSSSLDRHSVLWLAHQEDQVSTVAAGMTQRLLTLPPPLALGLYGNENGNNGGARLISILNAALDIVGESNVLPQDEESSVVDDPSLSHTRFNVFQSTTDYDRRRSGRQTGQGDRSQ
jgi:hypothetical protein